MPAVATMRLDRLLVERGLAPSGARARALVMAGRVRVAGHVVDKAGARIERDAEVEVAAPPHPYVSRGGVKLEGALQDLGLDPAGALVIDIGASTGGFTDCLLRHGARRVLALDVGHGQLDWTLRNDVRVTVVERFNARLLTPEHLQIAAGPDLRVHELELCVIDVSFISLSLILPPLVALDGLRRALCLVKPQFEVGRKQVGKGGIVRDPARHAEALRHVAGSAGDAGWTVAGVCRSRLEGADGNREFFLDLVRGADRPGPPAADLDARILAITGASR